MYPIFRIKEEHLATISRQRKILFFLNVPLMVAIPFFLESGMLASYTIKKANQIYFGLMMCDYIFLINSFLMFNTIKRVVSSIDYYPESNKLQIKQFNSTFLQENVQTVDPNDLVKCKGKTINRMVGYRSLVKSGDRYATESIGVWHDRQLMDSIVN